MAPDRRCGRSTEGVVDSGESATSPQHFLSISIRAVTAGRRLVVGALGQHAVDGAQPLEHRPHFGDGRRVIILPVEGGAYLQHAMERRREIGARVRAADLRSCGTGERQTVMMIVLVCAPRDCQPVRLVLDVAQEHVAQGRQRIGPKSRPDPVRPGLRTFWNRRLMAPIAWTSIPSSCQQDQINPAEPVRAGGPPVEWPADPRGKFRKACSRSARDREGRIDVSGRCRSMRSRGRPVPGVSGRRLRDSRRYSCASFVIVGGYTRRTAAAGCPP